MVPALTFCPYTTKQINFGFFFFILFNISNSDKSSALASKISILNPTLRVDWANNSAQVGGSIAEYVFDNDC